MIDHVSVNVSDLAQARAFYERALAPLGYAVGFEGEDLVYFVEGGRLDFGLARRDPVGGGHVAFRVADRETVHAFHAAALAAGGVDNGAPGPRPEYGEGYYAAFALDPDGNNLEAVVHGGA
ncbi:MAG: VOC family protein [Thermoleophilia bacterium]|nr:VOC family protein [Thermoleophilia bacterium]